MESKDKGLFASVEGAGDQGKEEMQGCLHNPAPDTMYNAGTQVAALSREDQLLQTVLASGNVEVLERFIALRNGELDRQSRLAFEEAFAKMRAALPTIRKSKEVKLTSGKHMYNYAPLEEIQKTCDPILQAHGFSYSWREEAIPEGKRVWFDLFAFGHTKSNCFDAPLLGAKQSREGGEITNAVQGARMTSSYAKRNSMVDGLGLIIEDEDDDANTLPIDAELKATLDKIEKAETLDKLLDFNKIALEKYANNQNARTFILGTYAQARKRLTGAPQ
jgi:hypothetical protein